MAGSVWRGRMAYLHDRVPVDVARAHKGATVSLMVAGEPCVAKLGTQVKVSLRTTDKALAKERYREVSGQLIEAYNKLRQAAANGPVRLTERQCGAIARDYFIFWRDQYQDDPGDPDMIETANEVVVEQGLSQAGREQLHGMWANDLLQKRGLVADEESRGRLLAGMHGAYLDAFRRIEDAGRGYWIGMQGGEDRFPVEVKAKPDLTLADVLARWVKDQETTDVREATITKFKQQFGTLVDFLGEGEGKDATTVTPEDIEAWLDHLLAKGLSRVTVGKNYLTNVKTIFKLSDRKLAKTWPFLGVKMLVKPRQKSRPDGYEDAEARAILNAAKAEHGVPIGASVYTRRAIRWVPWICAYTGARVGEITQLRKQDFKVERSVKFIRITPEAGNVKAGVFRDVPLHPHLLAEGLWEMVQALPDGPVFRAGEEVKADSAAGSVRQWIRDGAGMTDERVQPNHAWRHRFMTEARGDEMPEQVMMSIVGHKDGSVSGRYGTMKLATKAKALARMPSIDLTGEGSEEDNEH